jgi:hypothetical protein
MNVYRAIVNCYRKEGSGRTRCVKRMFLVVADNIRGVNKIAEEIADSTANSQPWVEFTCVEASRLDLPLELVATRRGLKEVRRRSLPMDLPKLADALNTAATLGVCTDNHQGDQHGS